MKHLLIILSFLLLSSFLTSCEKNEGTLYRWKTSSGWVWKGVGDKETHPTYEGDVLRFYIFEENGKPNGLGTLTHPTGEKYVGEYKDGFSNGLGTSIFPNGDKYIGEFKYGLPNGQGTYTWSDGRKYVGEFRDGYRNGQGTWTYYNGDKYVGENKDGEMWNGIKYDKNGNIIGKVVNGKKINQ